MRIALALLAIAACSDPGPGGDADDQTLLDGTYRGGFQCVATRPAEPCALTDVARDADGAQVVDAVIMWTLGVDVIDAHEGHVDNGALRVQPGTDGMFTRAAYDLRPSALRGCAYSVIVWNEGAFGECTCTVTLSRD